jgi:ubiquinone/menaquinone biosynthesis C-methylase UbiE
MDILEHNRLAWNQEALKGNKWTIPVGRAEIEAAFEGQYTILLTPTKPVPAAWLGDVRGKQVLCLASGGGQQGPLLAAAGAGVTVFDNSDEQLKRDRQVAVEFSLNLKTVQGNMQDLHCFPDAAFDLIVHPISNCFVDDILPVWRECYRVLKVYGRLLAGFNNPLNYMIDWDEAEKTRRCEIRYAIPYADTSSLSPQMKQKYIEEKEPFEFGHSLSNQIQGQIAAGFLIAGFYEDKGEDLLDDFADVHIATYAIKLPADILNQAA